MDARDCSLILYSYTSVSRVKHSFIIILLELEVLSLIVFTCISLNLVVVKAFSLLFITSFNINKISNINERNGARTFKCSNFKKWPNRRKTITTDQLLNFIIYCNLISNFELQGLPILKVLSSLEHITKKLHRSYY